MARLEGRPPCRPKKIGTRQSTSLHQIWRPKIVRSLGGFVNAGDAREKAPALTAGGAEKRGARLVVAKN
jgi:hypothetical protein